MKVKSFLLAVSLCAAAFVSCTKDPLSRVAGSYTYKISGSVSVLDTLFDGVGVPDTLRLDLATEQGQMNVLRDGDRLVLTFNDLFGEASVLDGEMDSDRLVIVGGNKKVIAGNGLLTKCSGNVRVSGEGRKLSDVLVLDMEYAGKLDFTFVSADIVSCEIRCVAKEN